VRRHVLAAYRDYPAGDAFTGMPADVSWHRAMVTPAELGTVQYIDYPYWTDFSGGTRSAHGGVAPDQRGEDAVRLRAAYPAGRQACTASAVLS
jgi:hypothetical protein